MPRKSLIIIVVVAVVGIAAMLWIVRSGSRADLLTPAMEHLTSTESFSAGVAVDLVFDSSGVAVPLRISGAGEFAYPDDGAMLASADMSVTAGFPSMKVMDAAVRLADDGRLYTMLDGLPQDLDSIIDVEGFNGAWFSLGESALSLLLPWVMEGAEAGEGAEDMLGGGTSVFRPGPRFDDTIMEGVPVAHYRLSVDRDNLAFLLTTLTRSVQGRICTEDEKIGIRDIVASREFIVDAWIDKRQDRFYLIKVVAVPLGEDEGASPVGITVKFTGFDIPVEVVSPDDARPLSIVLARLLRVSASSVGDGQ
ncbi:MAG: hypothetical protein U9Q03_05750 [Patescibacteria group bacterium]|nr:hypothetical protein [Patescibacteria group bacterium]